VDGLAFPHLMKDHPVRAFQIVQAADFSVAVRLVPRAGYTGDEAASASAPLRRGQRPGGGGAGAGGGRDRPHPLRQVAPGGDRGRPGRERRVSARVAAARLPAARYPDDGGEAVGAALERVAGLLGWDEDRQRGPLAGVIPPGARVLVKPNWVSHENQGTGGFEPLVTHGSLVRAVAGAALRAGAGRVLVGDAPLQGCDFPELLRRSGLEGWGEALAAREPRFAGVEDFRRTRSVVRGGVREAREEERPLEAFVLFDLAGESLLEPVTGARADFRVTQYDPRLMARTHAPGRHRYLVAREAIEADVVINLPKLKTHKKAGVTCALKNLIGINGNKEFLPHHRVGGAAAGGDCYPGGSRIKRALEHALDLQNTTRSPAAARALGGVARVLDFAAVRGGDRLGVEGSWSGNDTIWRTCLDLNRILLYGTADGTLDDAPRRRVVHLVDAVVAGQGDGPLSPDPLPLGLLLGAESAAAMDRVAALLLGYDPARIPVSREAFGRFRWPLAAFAPEEVALAGDLGEGPADGLLPLAGIEITHPAGWRDAAMVPAAAAAPPATPP
jgi:uncharacterized protein (DUF362 family)